MGGVYKIGEEERRVPEWLAKTLQTIGYWNMALKRRLNLLRVFTAFVYL